MSPIIHVITSVCDLTWYRVLIYNQIKMRSYWIRTGPKSTDCLYKRKVRQRWTQRHRGDTQGKKPCDNGGRAWTEASANLSTARTAGNYQKLAVGSPWTWTSGLRNCCFQPLILRYSVMVALGNQYTYCPNGTYCSNGISVPIIPIFSRHFTIITMWIDSTPLLNQSQPFRNKKSK